MAFFVLPLASLLIISKPDSVEPQTVDLVTESRHALDGGRLDDAIALLARAVAADAVRELKGL